MQALVSYTGVSGVMTASMTLTAGLAPSVCTIDVVPQAKALPIEGTLRWTFGGNVIAFNGARLDKIEPQVDASGLQAWTLTVLDRRWRWQKFGIISGVYNQYVSIETTQGKLVKELRYPKKPSELIALCMEAMGERNYDTSGIKPIVDQLRPEVNWDSILPAKALGELCDTLGLVVSLGLDDRVHFFSLGDGAALPSGGKIDYQVGRDFPEIPHSLVVVGDVKRQQMDFDLEPVGKDVDGTWKPINELSYRPPGKQVAVGNTTRTVYWSDTDRFTDVTRSKLARRLAIETVYRCYRIKEVPVFGMPSVGDVLPLFDEQVETFKDDTIDRPRPFWVYGDYEGREDAIAEFEARDKELVDDLPNQPSSLYRRGVSLDTGTGIVTFADPVFLIETVKTGVAGIRESFIVPAKVILRTAVAFRDKETHQFKRYELERKLTAKASGKQPAPSWAKQFINAVEIKFGQYLGPGGKQVDNRKLCDEKANYILDITEATLYPQDSATATYPGLLPVACDGAIRQVTWQIDRQGFGTTRVSRNREETILAPSYSESRFLQKLGLLSSQAFTTPQQQALRAQLAGKGQKVQQ